MTQLDIGQKVVIIRDKRDPLDIDYTKDKRMNMRIGRYEGYFPWGVMFNYGDGWMPGIYDWNEYISGEAVTQEDVPMRDLFPTIKEDGKYFALPVYKNRFIVGKTKLWEHEIDYQIINTQ